MAFYTAAFVLGNVNHSVDHNPGSIWDHSWVNSNGVLGAGNGTGTGVSSPACGAASARAVTGSFKNTQGNQLGSRFFNVSCCSEWSSRANAPSLPPTFR